MYLQLWNQKSYESSHLAQTDENRIAYSHLFPYLIERKNLRGKRFYKFKDGNKRWSDCMFLSYHVGVLE